MSTDMDVTPRGLRFVFVQMLFALTVGEIARQIASLVDQIGIKEAASSYTHLLLALILVATSWVGWTRSVAPGNRLPVNLVFSLPFLILLVDVALVVFYFIIVKGVEVPGAGARMVTPSSENETFWVLVVFAGYFLWDFLTKAVASVTAEFGNGPTSQPGFWKRLSGKEFWSRGWVSLLCVVIALGTWWKLGGISGQWGVVWTDIALISLVFLFRALKQSMCTWTCICIVGLVIAFYLALAY